MSEGEHQSTAADGGPEPRDHVEVSKEDADRLKAEAAGAADTAIPGEDPAGEAVPGEDPEDNPDLEGDERFDAG
ncbi:hypothetical protein ACFWEJ_27485 [Promicromonospora sp. NPDC060204]|uniref:hypothetical protein n=1 Tax=Promicromonospora sp. NPDC060204 TaxID=3347071 RepID=UPI003658FC85